MRSGRFWVAESMVVYDDDYSLIRPRLANPAQIWVWSLPVRPALPCTCLYCKGQLPRVSRSFGNPPAIHRPAGQLPNFTDNGARRNLLRIERPVRGAGDIRAPPIT